MTLQIGKYNRPGIYINEIDNSVIPTQTVSGLYNLVIGVSKKGPVNTIVEIRSVADLEAIFGGIDRQLERKGSFFHRTIAKMVESAPVYALNLLLTDDTLDRIDYKSVSVSTVTKNDIDRLGSYRRFFDNTGFWKRDTESFLNLVSGNQDSDKRAINFTNLSDKSISVFMFKSTTSGFDRTMIEWYGSIDKMPPYLSSNDYASDYMVDVLVVSGDWSNYNELAVDQRWSKYFNTEGLRKDMVNEFAFDRNVNTLKFYTGLSLVPFFRDANNRNIFIENVINLDTDRTGLFCSFNIDAVEQDFYNGVIDLLGNTIVDEDVDTIDFMSYKENITEMIDINLNEVNRHGNVVSTLVDTVNSGYGNDSSSMYIPFGSITSNTTTGIDTVDIDITGFTTSLNGSTVIVPTQPTITESFNGFAGGNYKFTIAIGTNGDISTYRTNSTSSVPSNPSVPTSDLVLISMLVTMTGGVIDSYTEIYRGDVPNLNHADVPELSVVLDLISGNIDVDLTAGFIIHSFDLGGYGKYPVAAYPPYTIDGGASDTTILPFVSGDGVIDMYISVKTDVLGVTTIDIDDSIPTITANEVRLGLYKVVATITDFDVPNPGDFTVAFSNLSEITQTNILRGDVKFTENATDNTITIEYLDTASTPDSRNYRQFRNIRLFNEQLSILTNSNKDKGAVLSDSNSSEKFPLSMVNVSSSVTSTSSNKSFVLSLNGAISPSDLDKELTLFINDDEVSFPSSGHTFTEIARHSELYQLYYDGIISNGDYFYKNILAGLPAVSITFSAVDSITFSASPSGIGIIVGSVIEFPTSILNKGKFTVTNINGNEIIVSEAVITETLNSVTRVVSLDDKIYMRASIDDSTEQLTISFVNEIGTLRTIDRDEFPLYLKSRKGNRKQTIEITSFDPNTPNVILIDSDRYSEVKVGDFLEATYDLSSLETGEHPRKLTRIIRKRRSTINPTLIEISCDSEIKITNIGGDLQVQRYVTIDEYVNSYKAMTLSGFRIRQESLPNGDESKQNSILNLVAKGTPLFRAITNKETFDFRYLVDSFGLGLTERSKQQLVDICGKRLDVFGFINMPSMKQFKDSTSPTFVDSEGVLNTEFIKLGGDPESNPAFLYSMGDGPGSTACGYFAPYVTVNDNGRPLSVPPAMHVATTYMRKHISNITSITPWTVSAGVINGKVTNIAGLEVDFDELDIENLNLGMFNPIVYKRQRGYVIETENTAQTLYKSSLSFIHCREVLIELERELSRMLLDFHWVSNTADSRAEIKLRADVICETFVNKKGLYTYFNKIDSENNTDEIIDNQMGYLQTYVELIKNMGVIVNDVTVMGTGTISSGGFNML